MVSLLKFASKNLLSKMVGSIVPRKPFFVVVACMFSQAVRVCFTGSPSPLDPFDSYFRVRLVCILLDTCGQYFDRGSSKKRLDAFLVYFQCSSVQQEAATAFGGECWGGWR